MTVAAKRFRYLRLALLMSVCLVAAMLLCAGCDKKSASNHRTVASPRIISNSTVITEILLAMNLGDHLVGVSNWCDLPETGPLADLPRVCDTKGIQIERAMSIQPEIFFTQTATDSPLFQPLRSVLPKLEIIQLHIETLQDIRQAILAIGQAVNNSVQATKTLEAFDAPLKDLPPRPSDKPLRVVFFLASNQPLVATKGTYIDDLLTLAHAKNVGNDVSGKKLWRSTNVEQILHTKPDVLIVHTSEADHENTKAFWQQQQTLPALKNCRIYVVTDEQWLRANSKVTGLIRPLWKLLYDRPLEAPTETTKPPTTK